MEKYHRFLVLFFVALFVCLLILSFATFRNGFQFNTDLTALLPQTNEHFIAQTADKQLSEKMQQRVLIVLTAENKQQLMQAGEKAQAIFCNNKTRSLVTCINPTSSSAQNLINLLSEHRYSLLNRQQIERINTHPETVIQGALKRLYGIGQWTPMLPTTEDPLGLFDEYIQSLLQNIMPFKQFRGMNMLLNSQGQESGLALFMQLEKKAYNLDYQKTFSSWFENRSHQFSNAFPDVKLLHSGVIFHASNAANNARNEITFISSLSLIGILLLFISCFRSLKPLLAGLFSLAFGCLSAIIICLFFLKELHLITLVFGASLIGVSIDYALHFFCEKHFGNNQQSKTGLQAITQIFPAITLGLITSLIGYGILTQAPMPGLKQIALFSISGLFCSWICVIALFPLFQPAKQQAPPRFLVAAARLCNRFWENLGPRISLLICIILLVCSVATIILLTETSDSIRTLYQPSKELMSQEKEIQTLVNNIAGNQYFIVRGKSLNTLLIQEQKLLKKLDQLILKGSIQGYLSNSQFIADQQTQAKNYQVYSNTIYNDNGLASRFFQKIGADGHALAAIQNHIKNHPFQALTLDDLHASFPDELKSLYLGKIDNQYTSLVLLRGIHSLEALKSLELPSGNIIFYDKVKSISLTLKNQQSLALKQLLLGYLFIALIIMLRYKKVSALVLIAIPLISSLVTIAILSLCMINLSLFHVFALFLILGLGMDYSIFLYDAQQTLTSSQIAVLLSAATSCLSFGLLSLSSTPMVAAFGLTILIGSLLNFALAPLVIYCKPS